MQAICCVLLLVACEVWAKSKPKPAATTSVQCSAAEVRNKDCRLVLNNYQISLGADNITIYDGVWRKVEAQPLVGSKVEWKQIRLRTLAKRNFVEFLYWSEPAGEVLLQNLHWYVGELHGANIKIALSDIVQRRRWSADKNGKKKLVTDPSEKFELTTKGQAPEVYWKVADKNGVLSAAEAPKEE